MRTEQFEHPKLTTHQAPTSPLGHRLMFVLFSIGAFVLFAPIILLPLIKDHCELLAQEALLVRVNQELDAELARQDALVEAFKSDATINERLAVLDLRYNNPDEETIPVLPPDFAIMPSEKADQAVFQSALKIPAAWPERVRRAEQWAQERGLIDLFLDPTLRTVFLLMAAGLLIAGFVLFAPRIQPEAARIMSPNAPGTDAHSGGRAAKSHPPMTAV
ncbi:MAG: hypothetical protein KF841_03660 [Phycisphaerae bacterium]|nr:hypothetical protein [Phycisphaerae bacterium]